MKILKWIALVIFSIVVVSIYTKFRSKPATNTESTSNDNSEIKSSPDEIQSQVNELKETIKKSGNQKLVDQFSEKLNEKVAPQKDKYLEKLAKVSQLNYEFKLISEQKNNYIFAGDSDNPKVAELDSQLVELQDKLLAESEEMNANYQELYTAYTKAAEEQLDVIRKRKNHETNN